MHALTALTRPVTIGPLSFTPGIPMLVEDVNAGEVLAISPDKSFACSPWEPLPIAEPARSILFILPGGFGDLVFLTAVLAAAAERYERVAVSCMDRGACVFENLPFAVEVLSYPLPVTSTCFFDHVVPLEGLIAAHPLRHPVDLFAEAAGIDIPELRRGAIYVPREEEIAEALENYPRTTRPRVGMQVRASALCRTYPPDQQVALLHGIANRLRGHVEIFLFGAPGECLIANDPPVLHNLTLQQLSFRQSCAMLSTCHAFIAPDSSLCHIAGALGIPTVALYGPFPWQSRTIYHPSIHAINGHADCAPCHHHKRAGREWPEHGPCRRSNKCEALATIDPERVAAKVEQMLSRP